MTDSSAATVLLVGTSKGAFVFTSDAARAQWTLAGPYFLGSSVNEIRADPRGGTWLMAAKAGHLGPTVYRRAAGTQEWQEAQRPPAFPKVEGEGGRSVGHVFCFCAGHASEPGVWYAGSSPAGLFRSQDDGLTWDGVAGFNDGLYPQIKHAVMEVPGGSILHSIAVDPRDAAHLYVALSTGGVFESTDRGANWTPLNAGVAAPFLPEPDTPYGHDPHCLAVHPAQPDRLYQQNHCGIYRLDRPATRWTRIGDAMPRDIGDIGFGLALHPRDPDMLWVFPMDGTDVWPRTCLDGRPAVYRSSDGGASWQRQDRGLPPQHAWFTVKRQALCVDAQDAPNVYFGTGSGELWVGEKAGANWRQIAAHLPPILSVQAVSSPPCA
ncbi:MAG: glycosyl hydrolase [Rhodocyclaceae bacterium]|nr:glycosyl hydrolase [Rhodocyclaceae bacterium]